MKTSQPELLEKPELPKKPELLTKSDIKDRGWTEAGIKLFLPEPDKKKVNPYYLCAPPMLLWQLEKVEAIEATSDWQEWKSKSLIRSQRALKIADNKRQSLLEEIGRYPVQVKRMEQEKLLRAACRHYNRREEERNNLRLSGAYYIPASPASDKAFLDRICVNYLRHHCTPYEKLLDKTFGRVGVQEAYEFIRHQIFEAIAEAYPWLKEECQRQEAKTIEMEAMWR